MAGAPAFDPNKPFEAVGPSAPPFDPNKPFEPVGAPEGVGASFARAVTDVPHEIYESGAAGIHEMNAVNPWGEERRAAQARGEPPSMLAVPRAAMGALGTIASPITGAVHSVGGHLLDLLNRGMRAGAVKLYGEDAVSKAEAATGITNGYEAAKGDVDKLMMGLGPRGGMRPVLAPLPARPAPGPLGVTLSEGQETGALPAIRREQAAARGQLGPAAEARAADFREQQGQQLEDATARIRADLDPFGNVVADTPQQAGQVVSQSVQNAARRAKAGVDTAYDTARNLPGEIAPETFTGMGSRIRDALSNAAEPVIIDDKLTPYASQAIQDIDNRVARLNIQNRASNTSALAGNPPPTIAGVTLTGVDQMRKRLSAFRQQAFGSGNASDGRAVRSVLDAFDTAIDDAINNGKFTGDARAVQAWNDARAAHADYRNTFGSQGSNKDRVSGVVQKILGNRDNPAAIPNDVADFLYGASGVNPGSLNVGVANRVRSIFGDRSAEWSAVKQGLFARLTETAPGVTDRGPGQIAQRLNKFLNGDGRELAESVYSPAERNLLQQYADLHRRLEIPRGGANWSETSTFVAPMFRKISNTLAAIVGGVIGHTVAPGLMGVGEGAGALVAGSGTAALQNLRNARQITRQMPLIAEQMARYQRALAAANRANAPISNRTASVALANLAKSVQPLGIDVYQLAPVKADKDERQRGGRLENEPDQRVGGEARGFARGGRVDASNIDHAPTEAQKEAGNYAKDHIRIHGLDITIENAKGHARSGVGRDGKAWSVKMPAHYGYFKGTVGNDRDHVDVYVGPHPKSPHVFIVDQMDAETGKFDEHKVLMGFASAEQARRTYLAGFSDGKGKRRLGHVAEMSIDGFRDWLANGDTAKKSEHAPQAKLPHSAVGYVSHSHLKNKHCSVCVMFREGSSCSLVMNPILPGGWCRRFDRRVGSPKVPGTNHSE